MRLLVGLGNPGTQYADTRHNAGFSVVDELATAYGAQYTRVKTIEAAVAKVQVGQRSLWLMKPLTYMNLSGRAVVPFLNYFKLTPADMLVIHDDVSMPLGRIRLQKNGGAGGQHGVESIIACLGGGTEFARLKIGVGPDPGGERRADFVLSPVCPEDRELYRRVIKKSGEAAIACSEQGMESSMNAFNGVVLGVPEKLRLLELERQKRLEAERVRREEEDRQRKEKEQPENNPGAEQ